MMCACGCGRQVKWPNKGSRYAWGHASRVKPNRPHLKAERNHLLVRFMAEGASLKDAVERFHISRQRVRQICARELAS